MSLQVADVYSRQDVYFGRMGIYSGLHTEHMPPHALGANSETRNSLKKGMLVRSVCLIVSVQVVDSRPEGEMASGFK